MFSFVSNNFESLGQIFLAVLGTGVIFYILFRSLENRTTGEFALVLERFVGMVIVGVALFLSLSLGSVYWLNYRAASSIADINVSAYKPIDWVKDNRIIYYADGNKLYSVRLNSGDAVTVFDAKEPIREFHFSSDGRYVAVVSYNSLYLINLKTKRSQIIDQIVSSAEQLDVRGVINGIAWSPTENRLCYELSRWTKYGSQGNVYIYDLVLNDKKTIQTPVRRISRLFWDQEGKNLYYFQSKTKEPSLSHQAYEVDVFKIPLDKLKPELYVSFTYQKETIEYSPAVKPYIRNVAQDYSQRADNSWLDLARLKNSRKPALVLLDKFREVDNSISGSFMTGGFTEGLFSIPSDEVEAYGVHLYLDGLKYAFSHNQDYEDWIADSGSFVGIDDADYLYFVKGNWFKKRILKIEREYNLQMNYQYAGGSLLINQIRWLPGGRHIIMNHKKWGVLILDPHANKIGVLIRAEHPLVGWGPN